MGVLRRGSFWGVGDHLIAAGDANRTRDSPAVFFGSKGIERKALTSHEWSGAERVLEL